MKGKRGNVNLPTHTSVTQKATGVFSDHQAGQRKNTELQFPTSHPQGVLKQRFLTFLGQEPIWKSDQAYAPLLRLILNT